MYEQSYEEYMRNVLGYVPNQQENTYIDYYGVQNQMCSNDRLEIMYPDIYKQVYPLVLREVENCNRNISEKDLNDIADKICCEIEEKENRKIEAEKNEIKNNFNNTNYARNIRNTEVKEDRQLRTRNNFLRDLIKILLLREIIGRPNFNRPPMSPNRPPFSREYYA